MLSLIEKAIALKRVYIFEDFNAEQLKVLAGACEEAEIRSNEMIFREGEATETLRIIISGSVKIVKDLGSPKPKTLATLKSGEYFGEMNLFDEEPHSASAVAEEETDLLLIRKENLNEILELYPEIALEIVRVFSKRLRAMNERLSSV
jgi:CRP/FNR family transcriptional regulator/CRP/FNR family cyclic AMP-dependent transcriptional regulator